MSRSSTWLAVALCALAGALALARCADATRAREERAPPVAEPPDDAAPRASLVEPAGATREALAAHEPSPRRPRAFPPPAAESEPAAEATAPPATGTLAGVVVDGAGGGLGAAQVVVALAARGGARQHVATCRTDALGRFRLEGALAGELRVAASAELRPPSAWTDVVLASGETRDDLELVLALAGRVEGSLDPSLGPVPGRSVTLHVPGGALESRDADVDAAGRFAFEDVTPHAYEIELRRPSARPVEVADIPTSLAQRFERFFPEHELSRKIVVREGETTTVVFGAARSIAVRGALRLRPSGAALAGAKVQAFPRGANEETDDGKVVSDERGEYALRVEGAGEYTFLVMASECSYAWFERTLPDADEVELDLELPGGVLAGRVLAEDGRPVAGAPVSILRDGPPEVFHVDRFRRVLTDELGRFEFLLLAPGTYSVRSPDGFQDYRPPPRVAFGRARLDGIALAEGGAARDLELRLPAECRIAGQVVDALGAPVAGARVRALDARGVPLSAFREAETDAEGRFEVAGVAAGTYTVAARAGEREGTSAPVAVEDGYTAVVRVELR